MREIFEVFLLRSREDMRGYIQNDTEALTEAQQDELEELLQKYDAEGCPDPLNVINLSRMARASTFTFGRSVSSKPLRLLRSHLPFQGRQI